MFLCGENSRRLRTGLASLSMILGLGAVRGQAAPAPDGAVAALFPPGPGRDLTVRVCSACHDLDIVAEQGMSASDWDDMVNLMAGRGAAASVVDQAAITAYLSKAFPEKSAASPPLAKGK